MPAARSPSSLQSLRWPVLFALLAAFVFFVAASTVRETYRGWKVDQEIAGLKAQVAQLGAERHGMTDLLDKMNNSAYVEQEARLRFNLKKPGEHVVLFDQGIGAAGASDTTTTAMRWSDIGATTSTLQAVPESPAEPIPLRWAQYFLGGSTAFSS